jgi:hypothetical protein
VGGVVSDVQAAGVTSSKVHPISPLNRDV